MSVYSTKDLTKDILLLASVGLAIPLILIAPGFPLALKPLLKKNYYPSDIRRTLSRMEKQKLISVSYDKEKTRIELLDKGKKRVLSYEIDNLKLNKGKWDGIWRVVIFDIPEKKRIARDFLRSKLKELGFFKLQKSVLVTPWDCADVVDFVKHFYHVGDYVNLILAKKLDQEEYLRQYFDL